MPPGKDQSEEIQSDRLRSRSRRLLYFLLCNLPIICVVPAAYPGFCSGEMRDEQEFARSLSAAAQGALTMGPAASKVAAPAITAVSLSRCTHTSYIFRSRRDSVRAESLWVSALALCSVAAAEPSDGCTHTSARTRWRPMWAPHNIIYRPADGGRSSPYQDAQLGFVSQRTCRISRIASRMCERGLCPDTGVAGDLDQMVSNNGQETARAYEGHVTFSVLWCGKCLISISEQWITREIFSMSWAQTAEFLIETVPNRIN